MTLDGLPAPYLKGDHREYHGHHDRATNQPMCFDSLPATTNTVLSVIAPVLILPHQSASARKLSSEPAGGLSHHWIFSLQLAFPSYRLTRYRLMGECLVSQRVYEPLDTIHPRALTRTLRGVLISREFSQQFLLALAQIDRGFDNDFAIQIA